MSKTYIFIGKTAEIETPRSVDSLSVYFKRPYWDKSARRRFESRTEKRLWMRNNKMREGGIVDPTKELQL